jgi:AcrR family transcriptional regulator
MARPKTPLIAKDAVVAAATKVLEKEGPKALTLRRLAADLNVNSASLYHHFKNKEEILLAVVRSALRGLRLPPLAEAWEDWICENAVRYRRLLIQKPFLIPLMLEGFRPATMAYSVTDAKLVEAGVPDDVRPEFMRVLDTTVVGSALIAINSPKAETASRKKARFDYDKMLKSTIRLLINDMLEYYAKHSGDDECGVAGSKT